MKEGKDLFTSVSEYLTQKSTPYLLTWGFILVLFVGVVDYKTGHDLSFSIFYLLPVAFVVWFSNREAGVFISVVSATTEFVANFLAGRTYSHPFISIWNSAVLLGFFLLSVFFLSTLKIEYRRRLKLIDELQDTVGELKLTEEELNQRSQEVM